MSEQPSKRRQHIIAALVENKPGVLNRVVSLFRRRNFNVDSLTVGRTMKDHISRITMVIDSERINPVIDVKLISEEPHVERDMALIKVRTDDTDSYNAVAEICERYPARIIDMGQQVAIIEITARADMVEEFLARLKPVGVLEVVRTGIIAMGRGTRIQDTQYVPSYGNGAQEESVTRVSV
jgi:acetolactate synthase-1/3 small subunit